MKLQSLHIHRRHTPILTLLVAIPAIMWKLTFTNLILARGDTLLYIYPYWAYRAKSLLAGQIPLWNPYLFMGAPFLANPQTAVLYPLNWPLIIFPVHIALKIAILAHIIIAGFGTYTLARKAVGLTPVASSLAALFFTLGGHMIGKVEQVNQFQSLAWLPWLLLFANQFVVHVQSRYRTGLIIAVLLALQFLSGHTQTTFITTTAILLWSFLTHFSTQTNINPRLHRNLRAVAISFSRALFPLIPYLVLGALLTGAQLLPTLELTQHSLRSDGLPLQHAVSFSLHPLLIGWSLLPSYSQHLPSEFAASIGAVGLLLAIIGVSGPRDVKLLPVTFLALTGLFFATGALNPVYWALVKFVPGFDLFRAPMRWLSLWSLGVALLAGLGFDRFDYFTTITRRRVYLTASLITVVLCSLTYLSQHITPPGSTGPLAVPAYKDLLGWIIAFGLTFLLFARRSTAPGLLILVAASELFLASLQFTINHPVTPEAYTSIRPAMTELIASKQDSTPSSRFLSISSLLYDPGDLEELRSLNANLTPRAIDDTIVAAKSKDTLSPNLSLVWQLPSVDGYDGGVLPTAAYAQFATAFAQSETISPDGRMREYITHTPPNWIMNITNTRWLITDKLHDTWQQDVFYDLQFQINLDQGEKTEVQEVRPLQATTVGIIASSMETQNGVVIADIHLAIDGGFQVSREVQFPHSESQVLVLVELDTPSTVTGIAVQSRTDNLTLNGLTLLDRRSGAFQTQTLGPYVLKHSGDVKVYENLKVFPRAYLVRELPLTPLTSPVGHVEIHSYTPRTVVITTKSDIASTLVLADSLYPGWEAQVDGQETEMLTINGLFRGLNLSEGPHEITIKYQPISWKLGLWVSGTAILASISLAFGANRRKSPYPFN